MTLPKLCTPPGDDASSTLASSFLHASATTVAVQPGDIGRFGTPTPASPVRFRMVRQSQQVDGLWAISDRTKAATYTATGVSGSTLTGVAFESGTDQDFAAGDLVAVVVTARDFADIHAYLRAPGPVNILAFGTVVGDGVTDDSAAIQAILDANPSRHIYFPRTATTAGAASYHCGSTLHLRSSGQAISGDGGGFDGTLMEFAAGVAGIQCEAGGCSISNLVLNGSEFWQGVYVFEGVLPKGFGGTSAADGIRLNELTTVRDVTINGFGRHGINADQVDPDFPSGCDNSVLENVNCQNNRGCGFHLFGGDANACVLTNCIGFINQLWGFFDGGALGNLHVGPQTQYNHISGMAGPTRLADASTVTALTRASNLVTLTFANDYTEPSPFAPGDGIGVNNALDDGYNGFHRVVSVPAPNQVVYSKAGPDGTSPIRPADPAAFYPVYSGTFAFRATIGPDVAVTSITRSGGTATLTFSAPYHNDYGGVLPFVPGQGVRVERCDDPSFAGTFIVRTVSPDLTTLTYAQAGSGSTTGGFGRMSSHTETWNAGRPTNTITPAYVTQVAGNSSGNLDGQSPGGIDGGAYCAIGSVARNLWLRPYSEGGQRIKMDGQNFILSGTQGGTFEPSLGIPFTLDTVTGNLGLAGTNSPLSVNTARDLQSTEFAIHGLTSPQVYDRHYQHPATRETIWLDRETGVEKAIRHLDPLHFNESCIRLAASLTSRTVGDSSINGEGPGGRVLINTYPNSGTGGLVIGEGGAAPSSANITTIVGGMISPSATPDSAATDGAIYLGSDHLDGNGKPKLCRRSGSTTVVLG